MGGVTDFLLELRSEEIPARMQDKACDDLARLFSWMFSRFVGAKDEPRMVDPDVAAVESKVSVIDDEIEDLAAKLDLIEEKLAKLTKPSATVTKFKPAAE